MKNIKTYKEFNEGNISNFVDKAKKSWKKFNAMPDDEIAEKILSAVEKTTYLEVINTDDVWNADGSDYQKLLIETTIEMHGEKMILIVGTITDLSPSGMTHWKLSFDGVDIDCKKSLKKKIYNSVLTAPERENYGNKEI